MYIHKKIYNVKVCSSVLRIRKKEERNKLINKCCRKRKDERGKNKKRKNNRIKVN